MGPGAGLTGAELKMGQYLTCVIEEVKGNGGVVRLSVSHSQVSTAIATEEQNWTLNNLLPGLVVKAQVQKVSCSLSLLTSKIKIIFIKVHAHHLKLCCAVMTYGYYTLEMSSVVHVEMIIFWIYGLQ